ncbi:MAG: GTPase HflX [Planctomycetota bacterium]|nr:MAG: GTPase HflX [Planctomycetota bacterium]
MSDERQPKDLQDFELGQLPGAARAVLILVSKERVDETSLDELSSLCRTAGVSEAGRLIQHRLHPSPSHYLGKGKALELKELVEELEADLVVCDEELSPVQGRNLEKELGVRVADRSEIILAIFSDHAQTTEARLQVELARLQYQVPRLRRLWTHLDRERGGTGALGGMGEKQIDVDRRLLQRRITQLRRRLVDIEARKQREIDSRRSEFLVSLVGYTNAGKSTLMNRLTNAGVLQEDKLFSTLDTRTKRWELEGGRHVLLSDTVGFIRSIPHDLVASFHATLAEALEADLLLVVADASAEDAEERLETVADVLEEIGAGGKDRITVLNKVDRVEDAAMLALLRNKFEGACELSAFTGEGCEALTERVHSYLDLYAQVCWLRVPHTQAGLQAQMCTVATVEEQRFDNEAAYLRVRATPAVRDQLVARGAELVDEEQAPKPTE